METERVLPLSKEPTNSFLPQAVFLFLSEPHLPPLSPLQQGIKLHLYIKSISIIGLLIEKEFPWKRLENNVTYRHIQRETVSFHVSIYIYKHIYKYVYIYTLKILVYNICILFSKHQIT